MSEIATLHTKFGTAQVDEKGYYRIVSRKEGNRNKRLHRLIWESYNGEVPEGMVIHHIDGNKTNNNISNLEALSKSTHTTLHNKGNNSRKGKPHSEETKKKLSDMQRGSKNPAWKNYARITRNGFKNGKQRYAIRFNGKILKRSIYMDKLIKWFEITYPNTDLIIEGGVVSE